MPLSAFLRLFDGLWLYYLNSRNGILKENEAEEDRSYLIHFADKINFCQVHRLRF